MVEKPLTGRRILIAEDNVTNQLVVSRMVEMLGGGFDLAADGLEAIQMFSPKRHNLALVDIEMPNKSGLDVVRHIRRRPDVDPGFPVIALTAFVLSNHRRLIFEAGANAIIAKPIGNVQEFGAQILVHLGDSGETVLDGAASIAPNKPDFDRSRLDDLLSALGGTVAEEFLAGLRYDLQALRKKLQMGNAPEGGTDLRKTAHALVSLAGLGGGLALARYADELQNQTAAMNVLERGTACARLVAMVDDYLTFLDLGSVG